MADILPPPSHSKPNIGGAAGRDGHPPSSKTPNAPAVSAASGAHLAPHISTIPTPVAIAGEGASGDGLPKKFGKYTLLRKLATGGMAELFLAIQRSVAGFEKLIVIKRILPAMNQDRAFIDMLLHEARVAATLSHPNIVQIFDVGQVDGIFFIAMEHVHGEDLRSIVRQMKKKGVNDFPLEHAISMILGVCAGLAYAHEKRDLDGSALNIVHRDISPQNVVVTFSGDVKIVDFGIAQSDTKLNSETKSGKLKGKVPYMSPEQARGDAIDWRSDIFAAGVMLFELTTGKRLFKGASEYETLKLICERDYPLPSQVRQGYPIELEYIVMKALAKDRNERFQSAREMQASLEAFVRRERIPVSTIALNQFMQSLFEDKLASQKEALLQGKQLADIIELQRGADSGQDVDANNRLSASVLSTPAASRTVTDLNGGGRRKGSLIAMLTSAVAVCAIAGGAIYWVKSQAQESARGAAANAGNAGSATSKGTIQVTSDPPGAAIWINGDLRGEVTPAAIAQLPTGSMIDVKLTKDGFEQAKQVVTLTDAEPNGSVTVALRKGSVSVDVNAKNDGAKIALVLDGKPYAGLSIDGLSSGDQHKLVVSAPGYAEQSFTFMGAPFERKHFDVVLERSSESSSHRVRPAGVSSSAVTVAPVGNGKLNVGASGGWCNVTVDGVARGATPVAGIELPAGPHRVTCAPPDGKAAQATTVTVAADGTTRYRFTLVN
jgi:serine/threonine protein kinase